MTKLIGITGRSGSGKGLACEIFARHGIPAIDTDAVYHEILAAPGACTDELANAFGTEILGDDGLVDRKRLSGAVFSKKNTPALLHTLNTITHKYIMAKSYDLLRALSEAGATAVLLDAPQLFEAHLEAECDLVLGVIAEDEHCIKRIMARDGLTRERAMARLGAQHSNDFFRTHCTAVIENNGTAEDLERAICQFMHEFGVK